MKSITLCVLSILAVAHLAHAEDAPVPQSRHARAVAADGSEYEQMPLVLSFESEAEKQALIEAADARDAAYAAWQETEAGKKYEQAKAALDQARRSRNEAKIAEATAAYEPLRAKQEKVREKLRRNFNRVLTLEQQKQWAGHMLYEATLSALRPQRLTTEQKIEAHRLCEDIARDVVTKQTMKTDPYLKLDKDTQAKAVEAVKTALKL